MENAIPIITVCITFILGVGGFIFNSLIQRKSNSIQVITKTRLERREKTKELLAKFGTLSDFAYIETLKTGQSKAEAIEAIVKTVAELRSEYTYTFGGDRNFVEHAYTLKESVVAYILDETEENKVKVKKTRSEFFKVADVYIQTEWKRIKTETVGNMREKKGNSWEDTFNRYSQSFDKNDKRF